MLAKRDHGKSARFGVRHTLRKGRRNGFVQRSVCKVGQSTRNAVQIPCAGKIRYRRDKGNGVAPPPERLPCASSPFADRKRVVSGKSVSARVELDGRLHI